MVALIHSTCMCVCAFMCVWGWLGVNVIVQECVDVRW